MPLLFLEKEEGNMQNSAPACQATVFNYLTMTMPAVEAGGGKEVCDDEWKGGGEAEEHCCVVPYDLCAVAVHFPGMIAFCVWDRF